MKIYKLWANNFRNIKGYNELEITGDIINLFIGETNGVGKSSWFFCLYYLLTGYVAGKTQDEYVNWDSNEMSCGVEFEYRGDNFKIECSYKISNGKTTGKAEKTVWINNEDFVGVTASNKKLKEYFETNLFIAATGLFQDAKTFTSSKDSERRDILKKVFNLDYTEEIKEIEKEEKLLSTNDITQKETLLTELKAKDFKLQQLFEHTYKKEEYDNSINNIEECNKKLILIESDIFNIEKNKKQKEEKEQQLFKKNQDLENIEKDIVKISLNISNIENYVEDCCELNSLQEKLSSIKLERIKQFDDSLLESERQKLSDLNSTIFTLKKELSDCKSGICPTCHKDFSIHDNEKTQKQIDTTQELINEKQKIIENLKNEKCLFEKAVNENNNKKRDIEIYTNKINSEKQKLENIKKNNEQSLISLNETKINKQNQKENIIIEIKSINNEISKIDIKNKDELEKTQTELKNVKITYEKIIKNYEEIENKNKLIIQQNKEKELNKIENEKLIIETQKQIDLLIIKKQQLTKIRQFLKNEFPSYVIDTMIESIQNDMNEFVSKVYHKDLNVEIKGNDDNIDVLYGTGSRKVDAVNASGAEKSLLALSYCYALNKFKDYCILFVDEIDSSLKEEAALKLAEMIDKVKNEYDFIGYVSHVNRVQDYFSIKEANIIEIK